MSICSSIYAQVFPTSDSTGTVRFWDVEGNVVKKYERAGFWEIHEDLYCSIFNQIILNKYGEIIVPNTPLISCRKKPKNGFIMAITTVLVKEGKKLLRYYDYHGNIIFSEEVAMGGDFYEGLAAVKKDGKWGFIDTTGNWVISPIFDRGYPSYLKHDCKYMTENYGVGYFQEGKAHIESHRQWGYINRKGNWIIEPQFKKCLPFYEGVAAVVKNKKLGYIDTTGNWVIEPFLDYSQITYSDYKWKSISENHNCSEGIIACKINNKWGYKTIDGQDLTTFDYTFVSRFKNGIGIVFKNTFKGIINKDGKLILDCEWEGISIGYKEKWIIAFDGVKYHLYDFKGKKNTENLFDKAKYFINGYASLKKDGQWGMLDQKGNTIISFQYDDMLHFMEGLIPVKKADKWGYIDLDGEVILRFIYDDADDFKYLHAAVKKDGLYFYINKKGKQISKDIHYEFLNSYKAEVYNLNQEYDIMDLIIEY